MPNETMTIGIVFGLTSAFIWATSSLAVKAYSVHIDSLSFNAFRMVVGSLLFLALLPGFGGWDAFAQLSAGSRLALIASVVIGVAFGDTLYFWSMTCIGAARALPISGIYPLFTWVFAVPVLGEEVTVRALIGTALVLASLYLLAPAAEDAAVARAGINRAGVLAAIAAAALWAISTTMMKLGLQDGAHVVVVNAFRLPAGALVLLGITQQWQGTRVWRSYDRRNLPGLIALSLYSTGLGAIIWVLAVQYAGAARAALLNTTAPLIGVPLSIVFLRERVTLKIAAGALLSLFGVWMIL